MSRKSGDRGGIFAPVWSGPRLARHRRGIGTTASRGIKAMTIVEFEVGKIYDDCSVWGLPQKVVARTSKTVTIEGWPNPPEKCRIFVKDGVECCRTSVKVVLRADQLGEAIPLRERARNIRQVIAAVLHLDHGDPRLAKPGGLNQ